MRTEIINKTNSAQSAGSGDLEIIPGTGWTYFDAAAMANELNREARLFPKHRRPAFVAGRSSFHRSAGFKAEFFRQTGWSWDDAVDEAGKHRHHHQPSRLFL